MTGLPVVRYTRERLPLTSGPGALAVKDWPRWTLDGGATFMLAVRIVGPFEVEVDGQVTECPNGWLAMLPDGCPVAIPVDEFRRYGRWQPDAEEATA